MTRLNINIPWVCEIKWANNEDFISNGQRVIQAVGEKKRKRNWIITRQIHEEMCAELLSTDKIIVVAMGAVQYIYYSSIGANTKRNWYVPQHTG